MAGAYWAGYGTDGIECATSPLDSSRFNSFKFNVAHSINGDGFVVTNPKRNDYLNNNCYEAGYICAYKNTGYGVITNDYAHDLIYRNMILIDNH